MNRNQKCQVNAEHKFWPHRIGYFQFEGEGPSAHIAVLSAEPVNEDGSLPSEGQVLFSVWKSEITPI